MRQHRRVVSPLESEREREERESGAAKMIRRATRVQRAAELVIRDAARRMDPGANPSHAGAVGDVAILNAFETPDLKTATLIEDIEATREALARLIAKVDRAIMRLQETRQKARIRPVDWQWLSR